MSISASDIKFYKATTNNNTNSNGGVIDTDTAITTNVLNNLFPNVNNTDRTAGVTRYRKMFMKNDYSGELTAQNPKVWIGTLSTAGDYFRLKAGTDTDVQSTADDYTNWAGSGTLGSNATAGGSTLVVDFNAANGVYTGSLIRIDDVSNDEELTVTNVSWATNRATITISGELSNSYTAASTTVVSTIVELDDLDAASSSWTEHSSSGTYDDTTYPLTMYAKGTVSDTWTLTFDDASNFQVVGASTGSVGSGDISNDFTPPNGESYYFSLDKDGWGGTWAAAEYVTWTTTQAAKGIWVKEVVPAATASATNTVILEWSCESA